MERFSLIPPHDRQRLAPLFSDRRTLVAIVDGVLAGSLGEAWVPNSSAEPRVARLDLGCYAVLGGSPEDPAARGLVASVPPPRELVFPADPRWRQLIQTVYGERVRDRPMEAYSGRRLEADNLAEGVRGLPEGYQLTPLTSDLTSQLGPSLEPHALQVFADAEAFHRKGLGWCVRQGDRVVAVASSYAVGPRHLEVAISCHQHHRRQGLARAVASQLLLEALERKLEPHWNAANPISKRLALRLGFEPVGVCEVLFLELPPSAAPAP